MCLLRVFFLTHARLNLIFATKKHVACEKFEILGFFSPAKIFYIADVFGLLGDPADFDPAHLSQSHCLHG